MTPSDAHLRVSRKELAELEDLTHHLSDFITLFVYHASLLPPDLPSPVFERTMILTGLVTKIETYVKKLMRCLGQIGDRAQVDVPITGASCAKHSGS